MWLLQNWETVLLVVALLGPHVVALLPASWRANPRTKLVLKLLDLAAANHSNARNAPKKTAADLMRK